MKKKQAEQYTSARWRLPSKWSYSMKIGSLVLTGIFLSISAVAFPQRVTVKMENATLKQFLEHVQKQVDVALLYSDQLISGKRITVNTKNRDLKEVLSRELSKHNLTFRESDGQITIVPNTYYVMEGSATSALQEKITVKGRVFNTQLPPQALENVSISIKGGAAIGKTGSGGYYDVSVPKGSYLVFTLLGYRTHEVLVNKNERNLDISLQEHVSDVEEVIVVGYGTQKKATLSGAVSVLNMETKANQPITNVSQALHGVNGLWVNQTGGKPGQDVASIKIRGVGTTNNSSPLVLVDGIEYNMNEVNPAFIESVTVLKDASAAIYGSRAANGVILVTTKQGKEGTSKINYSFYQGIQTPTMLPDVVWDPILYMQMRNRAMENEGKPVTYTDDQIEDYSVGMASDPYTYPNINWFDYVLKNGSLQQHNLQFSGGTDRTQYSLSLGYMNQDGILIDANHANRYSIALNLTSKVSDRLKVGGNIIGNYRKYTENQYGTEAFFNSFMRVLPIFTPMLADGKYGNSVFATPGRNSVENLLMLVKEGSKDHGAQRILTKVFADYQLPFDLTYNVNLGVDKLDGYARQFVPYLTTYHPITEVPYQYNNNPRSYNYNDNNLNLSFYQTLGWQRQFNKQHNVSIMAGTSYTDFDNSYFSAQIEGYFDNTLTDISVGKLNPSNRGNVTRDKLVSYFGRINYDFDNKYLIDGSLRYDGSSRFGPAHRWGLFPAVSAAWRIDRETFLKEKEQIDLLKLRASWGKLGNQSVPLYSYLNAVELGQDYSLNNVINPGAAVLRYNDPSISWETTTTYNGGVDFEGWNGKLGVVVDVFKRRTSGILRPVSLPSQMGNLSGPQRNIGVVDNDGYEISLSHRNTAGELSYQVSGGFNYVRNKIVDLNGETVISGRRILKEGYPIDSYYVYLAEGIYQNQAQIDYSATVSENVKPGFLKYRDINGDGKIDGDDRIITGNSIPKYTFNFSSSLSFKRFELAAFFQGVQGIHIYPTANLAYPINNGAGITSEWVTGSWTPENPNAKLPLLVTPQGGSENYQGSTFWLKDASYLRLQNVQLSYDFPAEQLARIHVSKLTLFANAQNLLTFSKYKQFDPEKEIKQDNLYSYPMLKTFSFGLNVTF